MHASVRSRWRSRKAISTDGLRPALLSGFAGLRLIAIRRRRFRWRHRCLSASFASTIAAPYAPVPVAYAAAPAPVAYDTAYRLYAGDKLRIVVYGQEGLTNTYAIDPAAPSHALDRPVPARGRTPAALLRKSPANCATAISGSSVAVEIESYRPFFILGEVAAPRPYSLRANMSVESAVAIAGGFSPRARRRPRYVDHTDAPVRCALWCRSARRSVPAIPFRRRTLVLNFLSRHSGRCAASNPESRDFPMCNCTSRSGPSDHPGNDGDTYFFKCLAKTRCCVASRYRRWLVVTCALLAIEAVLRPDRYGSRRRAAWRGWSDVGQRNARILFAEMQLRRHFGLSSAKANDGAAIIADRRR